MQVARVLMPAGAVSLYYCESGRREWREHPIAAAFVRLGPFPAPTRTR